ncbi:phosphate ABC transporter, permease PstA [Acinetobacter nectaris CIP 110549]|uniref:Phosphate transport system permease protein PstA n=1 Tax=Acinetobacter nectaris CIP 110549 TaxID=1392540 RepID=V2T8C1_9GAMM|nr:phosphate ABC transporter permease PstA [Acinetobacter nectaris]ESK38683.1 phosphate ABC transporter, permease PstA [Acinetobacter nectaris CIP 110549]MCF8999858.1 phosphate ABC transporter permease PstA [Acinetobacter nectaris]MCF9027341.1 phosphate ABC transporter permease PstA [Acinetobacter nectaris]MCF9046549.1 phosphate ABC transporter permease PstA [Acinetobacter nectaris]
MSNMLWKTRQIKNVLAKVFSLTTAVIGLFWLVWILWTTLTNGLPAINMHLITAMTPPPGESGGMLNAIVGSIIMSTIAILVGTPIGIAAGTYLSEYARETKLGFCVRFINDILLSAPSIVIGLFVYEVMVRRMGHFSALAGSVSLAFLVLPVVVRTTDEMLQLVPNTMREAAQALGIPRWKIVNQVLYRAAMSGIITGILLALARILGETAPLLFTALNNQYWSTDIMQPMANVPVVIFQYAMSPYDDWHALAWAGALVMTLFVLILGIISRSLLVKKEK